MAEFLTQQKLEDKITDIIFDAKNLLLIFSPYIKLDNHFKTLFSNHIKNPEVHITIVFGKNEDDKGKSLRNEDFEFFKQFPNISILYLTNLHAKYYANESASVITSINLHDYSFKNNIEFGIYAKTNGTLLGINTNPFSDGLDMNAWECAKDFRNQAEAVFIKRPQIQKKMFGLSTSYVGSDVCYDNTEFFTKKYNKTQQPKKTILDFPEHIEFGKALFKEKPVREQDTNQEKGQETKPSSAPQLDNPKIDWNKEFNKSHSNNPTNSYNKFTAFCIRTGERIRHNTNHPYSNSAYDSWKQWRNEDYQENFCHSCGRPSATSMRRPLCDSCFYNS